MASANETVLLKSTLEIHNKAYSVKLTATEIYWETITSARATSGPYSEPLVKGKNFNIKNVNGSDKKTANSCPDTEVVEIPKNENKAQVEEVSTDSSVEGVETAPLTGKKTENQTVKLNEILAVKLENKTGATEGGKFQHLEMVALSATAFSIYHVKRIHRHRWRDRKVTFYSKDSSVISQWVEKIQEILHKPEFNRPKNVLVFINPYGGKRKAPKVYREKVAPLFELAGMTTDVIVTQRANHARDTLLEYDLSKVDGLVCVGGDGMFSELMHGLLTRTQRDNGSDHPPPGVTPIKPELRIGIIPGGSTDTVAYSTVGYNDAVTSALHIIVGDSMEVDVATIHHGNQFLRYNISLLGYGFYGECILASEENRWMGPLRYNWAGLKKVCEHKVYEGEVTFLPSTDTDNHPRDGTRCRAGCQVCLASHNGTGDAASASQTTKPDDIQVLGKEGWQKAKGRFLAINCFCISCKCKLSPEGASPSCHLGDGYLDLVLIHECSRLDYVQHLYRCMQKTSDRFDFPFISVHRVKEVKFRPLVEDTEDTHDTSDTKSDGQLRLRSKVTHNSVWNCDGEVIEEPSLDVRVHRQIIRLFARGVEEDVKDDSSKCLSCANGS